MIHQNMPRKGSHLHKDENKGFFMEGKDFDDCLLQLREWCDCHKDKWVYYHDCGVAPSKPIPVARNVFEVVFFDAEPAAIMWSWRLFQIGCERRKEIDSMTAEEKSELRIKQAKAFCIIGSSFRQKRGK